MCILDMIKHSILTAPKFLEGATCLEKETRAKLVRALWLLSEDFRHPSLQCKKVQGARASMFECRVDQEVRLIYDCVGGVIRCWYIGHHDDALRAAIRLTPVDTGVESDDIEVEAVECDNAELIEFCRTGTPSCDFRMVDLDNMRAILEI